MTIRVAACQLQYVEANVDNALRQIHRCAEQAASRGVDLVCLPECFLQGYLLDEVLARRHALDLSSSAFAAILEELAAHRPMLVFGFIEIANGALFNTAAVVRNGELLGTYRKTHIHSKETIFQPGTNYPVFEIDGITFGIMICYDSRFDETVAPFAAQGVRLILCPANNMLPKETAERMKDLHNPSRIERAQQTHAWVVSADVTGETDDKIGYGPTAIIDPFGTVMAQVPTQEVGMVVADIS